MKLSIELTADEYNEAVAKRGDRDWREILLDSLGVKYEPRHIGRPLKSDTQDRIDAYYKRCQEANREAVRQDMLRRTAEMAKHIAEG